MEHRLQRQRERAHANPRERGKKFITNAVEADALCVLARTSDRGVTSHTLLVVPMSGEGVSVQPLSSLGNQGTLGEVQFDGVWVQAEAVLGVPGQGLLLQIRRLAHERAFVAVVLAAMAAAALRSLAAAGRANGEAARCRLAELVADVEEARHLAYHAVGVVGAGGDARTPAAMAKLVAAQALRNVAAEALHTVGSASEQSYRDALGFAFAGGTDNMLLEAIAR